VDGLSIDLELVPDGGTGMSRGVENNRSLDVIWGKQAPTSGHPVAFEKGQNGRP